MCGIERTVWYDIRIKRLEVYHMKVKVSAGLLLYKIVGSEIYFFLVHPGGPFFKNRDEGFWTIPKGEIETNESDFDTAKREFFEEIGYLPKGDFIKLDPIKQKGGKIVKCWAIEGDIDPTKIISNNFEIEWPSRSGQIKSYPEVDRAGWFQMDKAKAKINVMQIPFLQQISLYHHNNTMR